MEKQIGMKFNTRLAAQWGPLPSHELDHYLPHQRSRFNVQVVHARGGRTDKVFNRYAPNDIGLENYLKNQEKLSLYFPDSEYHVMQEGIALLTGVKLLQLQQESYSTQNYLQLYQLLQ